MNEAIIGKKYKGASILITGGAGFIGSTLAKKLVQYGAQVTILDNLSTGLMHNIENLLSSISFIQDDIKNMDSCLHATEKKDLIFHLAAFTSVPESDIRRIDYFNNNITGTAHLLEAATYNKVKRFIFSSSAAVYGNKAALCVETDTTGHPTSVYGYSKLMGELLCKQYYQLFQLHSVSLRYFNVYGPGQRTDIPYPSFPAIVYEKIKNNESILINGDGKQTRDFVPIEQVVFANLFFGIAHQKFLTGDAFNIATGKSVTLIDYIELVKQEFPQYTTPPKITNRPIPGDILHSAANCEKFTQCLKQYLQFSDQ